MKDLEFIFDQQGILLIPQGMILKKMFLQNGPIPLLVEMEDSNGVLNYAGFQTTEENNSDILEYRIERDDIPLRPLSLNNFILIYDNLKLGGNQKLAHNKDKIGISIGKMVEDKWTEDNPYNFSKSLKCKESDYIQSNPEDLIGEVIEYIRVAPFSNKFEIATQSKKIISIELELIDYIEKWMLDELPEDKLITKNMSEEFITHSPAGILKRISKL